MTKMDRSGAMRSAKSRWTEGHLKKRKSHRPIAKKPKAGERKRAAVETAVAKQQAQLEHIDKDRVRMLDKLLKRQQASGAASASATARQIAEIYNAAGKFEDAQRYLSLAA